MKASIAIKKYLESDHIVPGMKIQSAELLEVKKATDKAEWEELGKQACKLLGQTYEPAS